jgi:hypothetical protein
MQHTVAICSFPIKSACGFYSNLALSFISLFFNDFGNKINSPPCYSVGLSVKKADDAKFRCHLTGIGVRGNIPLFSDKMRMLTL